MTAFAEWLFGIIKKAFDAFWVFVKDAAVEVFDLLLSAVVTVLGALPVPSFMQGNGLSPILSGISQDVWFFASHFKFAECFAVLGAAVSFRLVRKAITLFQW